MQFAQWLSNTALSMTIQNNEYWLWPTCESLHFLGLSMLVGTAGFFDFRLMGFVKRVPLRSAWQLMPWGTAGFLINLATGLIFLIAEPTQYYMNATWWYKFAFLIVAGANALIFQVTMADKIGKVQAGEDTPTSFKIAGAVSLMAWFGVLYCGRMMPFLSASLASGL